MVDRLIIQDLADGKVGVALHRSGHEFQEPAGEPVAFSPPLDDEAREDLRWYLEDYLRAPYGVYEARGPAIQKKLALWGKALFEALFGSGPARDAYVKAREGTPTELVLSSGSAAFLSLPWELMQDPKRPTPLALELAGIARTLPAEAVAESPGPPGEALRVLMVIARPSGLEDVGYRMIARPLLERLEPISGQVELAVLRPPTLDALEAKLKEAVAENRPYQILHFDGHGVLTGAPGGLPAGEHPAERFEADGAQGYVLFEQTAGGRHEVSAGQFASALKQGQVPLVVLNACQSGALGEVAEAAIATRLLQEGTAAVVAMGYSVYVVAAAEFMAAFYEALFSGEPVVSAVAAGRRRLYHKKDRPSPKGPLPLEDWIVPVHYLRRQMSFPALKPKAASPTLTLDDALDRLREGSQPEPEHEGVHVAGSLEPVGRFVGRDAAFYALELAARLQRVVLVQGPGGTGKTELAKAFARWWRDTGGLDDPSLVFFHSFEPGVASFGLDGVVLSLGLKLFGPNFIGKTTDPKERRALILGALRKHCMLLIWDNFESVYSMPDPGRATPPLDEAQCGEVKDFLDALAREGGKTAVIITSRSEEVWLGKELRRLEVGGLRPDEAAEYAEDLLAPYPKARARRGERAFAKLLEWLDGHPLSMRLLLPQLEQTTPKALLKRLHGQGTLPKGFEEAEGRLASLGASV